MIKLKLVDRIKFVVERQFVKGAAFQLLVVAAVIGLISVLGGLALALGGTGEGFLESVWWAFLRLTDSGYLGDDQGAWRRVVSTVLTVSGYVVFLGALVAIMTQWLIARMREFERGLTPVTMRQHIVIVGWTNRTLPLLRELVGPERAREQFQRTFGIRRLRAVVLSENASPAQAHALRAYSRLGRRAHGIVLRYGSPLEEEAIHRAGCLNAAVVIMPTDFGHGDDLVSADIRTIRSLLSIDARAYRNRQPPPLAVAELQDMRRSEMAQSAYRGPLEIVPSGELISRLLTKNLIHPGLSLFCREVFTALEGNELLLQAAGDRAGTSFGQAAEHFPRAVLLGVVRTIDGQPRALLNPPPTLILETADRMVMLARSLADTLPVRVRGAPAPPVRRGARRQPRADRSAPHRLLILGWNQRLPNLLDELASHGEQRFELRLVSTMPVAARLAEIERYSQRAAQLAIDHIEDDFLLSGTLNGHDLAEFSSVLLLASDRVESEEEADARTIVGHRLVESLLVGRRHRPRILLELADAANEGLARMPGVEAVVSPLIIGHLLARIALEPAIRLIFDELFSAGGAEIGFHPPLSYGLGGGVHYARMEAVVAAAGDTLLGVVPAGGDQQLVLNPGRSWQGRAEALCVLTGAGQATGAP